MSEEKPKANRRKRTVRNFPATTFSEAEQFAKAVFEVGAGQPVKRLTLFDQIGKSPDSGPSRAMVTNSGKYGLTTGSYAAEDIALTDLGLKVVSDQVSARERERARIQLAIADIEPFQRVYEMLIGNKLPASAVLMDRIKEFDVAEEAAEEAVDTLIVNLRDVSLLQTLSGAERVISIDARLDEVPASQNAPYTDDTVPTSSQPVTAAAVVTSTHAAYESSCFYITPIGQPRVRTH